MTSIRTVIITMSRLFRDLVTATMADHCHVDLIAELDRSKAIEGQLQVLAPELVLVGLADGEGDEIGAVLAGLAPDARVIAFSSDKRHAFVHQRSRQRRILLDVSPQQLIDAALGHDG